MSQCATCHAGCCRSFAVPVTGADILKIERDLGLDFWDFCCRWEDPNGAIVRKYAPHFHFADEPETPFAICLKHETSDVFPGTSRCRFLDETPPDAEHPRGLGKCGIYGSRPSACRVFPTRLNDTNELAIIEHVPEHGRPGEDPVYQLCQKQWTPEEIDPIDNLQDLAVAHWEMSFFQKIAAIWNRAPQEWEAFPEFLRMVYAKRVMPKPAAEPGTTRPADTGPIDDEDTSAPATIRFPSPAERERRAA